MNLDLDTRLREALRDERWSLPGWPDPTARVVRGIVRRRRLRRLAMAAVAGAAALLAALPAAFAANLGTAGPAPSPSATPAPTTSVVPWLEIPGTVPTPEQPQPRPTTTPCTPADLATTATVVSSNGAAGTHMQTVGLRVIGHRRCTLAGTPALLVRDSAGHLVSPRTANDYPPPEPTGEQPATVDPGELAQVTINTSASCDGGIGDTRYTEVYLSLAGTRVRIDQLQLDYTCDNLSVGRWYRPVEAQRSGPLADAGITATLTAPAAVAAGGVLDYQVTLTNPTDSPVPLDPCPVFRESFGKSVGGFRTLNCAAAPPSLPAHGSVTFAMKVIVPASETPGPTPLSWEIEEARGPAALAAATVTVTPG